MNDRHAGLCAASESPYRLNDQRHCALRRSLVGEEEARVSRDDADQRQRRQVERLGGERGADEDLRSATTERIKNAVARADRRCRVCIEAINNHVGERRTHLGLEAFGATTQRANTCPTTRRAASEWLRCNAAAVAAQQRSGAMEHQWPLA